MSRGPGRWQRAILDALGEAEAVVVTNPDFTTAEQVAVRRAAHRLAADGRIVLTSQRVGVVPRLVAYRAGATVPPTRVVTGRDGKTYMMPALGF